MNRDDLQKKLDGLRQVADQHGTMTGDTTEQQYEDLGDAIAQVEQFLKEAAHHTLKIKPEPFADLLSGAKTCEVRANLDRDFRAGDTVTLLELAPLGKPGYSGRQMTRTVTHVQEGYGLPVGLCVLSYAPVADVQWAQVRPWYEKNEQMLRDVCRFEGLKGVAVEVWRAARTEAP